jgi:hypothetical protein
MFMMACAAEAGAFIMLREEEFTWVVCIKSFVMCCIWMGRDDKGVFVNFSFIVT